jgi:hypothetical protein
MAILIYNFLFPAKYLPEHKVVVEERGDDLALVSLGTNP